MNNIKLYYILYISHIICNINIIYNINIQHKYNARHSWMSREYEGTHVCSGGLSGATCVGWCAACVGCGGLSLVAMASP